MDDFEFSKSKGGTDMGKSVADAMRAMMEGVPKKEITEIPFISDSKPDDLNPLVLDDSLIIKDPTIIVLDTSSAFTSTTDKETILKLLSEGSGERLIKALGDRRESSEGAGMEDKKAPGSKSKR